MHQWWITGFNPRYKDARPEYMVSIGRIDFSDRKDMYYAIKKYINKDENYGKDISRRNLISDDENYTIWICFDKGAVS